MRLTAPLKLRLGSSPTLEVSVGGAELNVLVAVAQLGLRARWVTRLPDNQFGRLIAGHARRFDVEVIAETETGGRAGLYFVELGSKPRPAEVLYDRAASAGSHLRPGQFDWPQLLRDAQAFHATGITCGLGSEPEQAVLEALRVAQDSGVLTSFDLNYRSRLWGAEEAAASFRRVLPGVDVLFASPYDLELVTGERGDPSELAHQVVDAYRMRYVIVRSQQDLGGESIVVTVAAVGKSQTSSAVAEANVVDPFGAGDVAAAAFLAAHLGGDSLQGAVRRAVRACAHKYTVPGDAWIISPGELDRDDSGRRIVR